MAAEQKSWRCYWCDAVFTDRAKAEMHFGAPHSGKPAPECLRLAQREAQDCRASAERLGVAFNIAHGALLCIAGSDDRWKEYATQSADGAAEVIVREVERGCNHWPGQPRCGVCGMQKCGHCGREFKNGDTCWVGGCPMGGDC